MPTVAAAYFEAKASPVATPASATSRQIVLLVSIWIARAKVKNYKHKKSCEGICYNNRSKRRTRRTRDAPRFSETIGNLLQLGINLFRHFQMFPHCLGSFVGETFYLRKI